MKIVQTLILGAAVMVAPFALAAMTDADIVIIGEVHDNPAHHAYQLSVLQELTPKAVVYEMLLPHEAKSLNDTRSDAALVFDGFHWSNIQDYAELFEASSVIIGAALPRQSVRDAFSNSAASVFGNDAEAFGLLNELPKEQQTQREDLQFAAHCEAMPRDLMTGMVEAQRLRDAHFAKVTLDALDQYGAPVVVITGNGHAREDWGIPAVIDHVNPELNVVSIGQSEDGAAPDGGFDLMQDAPSITRGDPCAAFQ